jgi:hypothetical protein
MTYHMRDMKNIKPQPPETLADVLLALACACGSLVLWLILGAALI